jgi:hypothetical protein
MTGPRLYAHSTCAARLALARLALALARFHHHGGRAPTHRAAPASGLASPTRLPRGRLACLARLRCARFGRLARPALLLGRLYTGTTTATSFLNGHAAVTFTCDNGAGAPAGWGAGGHGRRRAPMNEWRGRPVQWPLRSRGAEERAATLAGPCHRRRAARCNTSAARFTEVGEAIVVEAQAITMLSIQL